MRPSDASRKVWPIPGLRRTPPPGAEAIIHGEHRLLFVLGTADRANVERFLEFLTHLGAVEILPARSTERANAGGCIARHDGRLAEIAGSRRVPRSALPS
jgi:hypothetical protein